MEPTTNVPSKNNDPKSESSEPTVRANVAEELKRLRDELSRTAHEIRMKTKGASAEVQDTRRMLEREVKRFGAEVEEAAERTQEDLLKVGKDLRKRFDKLANEIVLPAN